MGRSKIAPIVQPDDVTCGPSALKVALEILGKKYSFANLKKRCQTTVSGTSTKEMIQAIKSLGYSTLYVEHTDLRHLQRALKHSHIQKKAVIVGYLYDRNKNGKLDQESEHWAVVSSFSATKKRIYLLDSYSGQRKSYDWQDFRERWVGYSDKRRNVNKGHKQFQIIRKKEFQLMLIVSINPLVLPKFKIRSARTIIPARLLHTAS